MAPRRSLRLHPQIHTNQEEAGTARRRSPRLHPRIQASASGEGAGMTRRRHHPQIQASEDGAGVTRQSSPRLHPEVHASEEVGAGMTRRGTSPADPATLPDSDDMLREILLRLPPQPSSLPRASAVSKRWRRIVTDPKFHRQFCAHHGKPPLLGYFHRSYRGIVLTSVMDPPDRIPPHHFDLVGCDLLDCRHGLVLLKDNQKEVVVRDLITRVQRRLAIPPELRNRVLEGAVLCAAAAGDHVHGNCHSSPFKVVLVTTLRDYRPLACVYSSETGLWGNIILTQAKFRVSHKHVVLVGHCLYWMSIVDGILEFDLDDNSLTVIRGSPVEKDIYYKENCQIIEAGDGVVGLATWSYPRFQLWQRNINTHGVATWVPWKTLEMRNIPGLPPTETKILLGYDQDTDVIFFYATGNVYEVQLKLMQSKKLHETLHVSYYRPFKSFCTPGTAIADGFNGAEMLHRG